MGQIDLSRYVQVSEWEFKGALNDIDRDFLNMVVAEYAAPARRAVLEELLEEYPDDGVDRFERMGPDERMEHLSQLARARAHVGPSTELPPIGKAYAGVDYDVAAMDLDRRCLAARYLVRSESIAIGEDVLGSSFATILMGMYLPRWQLSEREFKSFGQLLQAGKEPKSLREVANQGDEVAVATYSALLHSVEMALREHADELWKGRSHDSLQSVVREDINDKVRVGGQIWARRKLVRLAESIQEKLKWLSAEVYCLPGSETSPSSPEFLACLAAQMVADVMPTVSVGDALRWVVAGVPLDVPPASYTWEDRHTVTIGIARAASIDLRRNQLLKAWETVKEGRDKESVRYRLDIQDWEEQNSDNPDWEERARDMMLGGARQAKSALDFLAYEFCQLVEYDLRDHLRHDASPSEGVSEGDHEDKWMRYLRVALDLALRMELKTTDKNEAEIFMGAGFSSENESAWKMVTRYIDNQRNRTQQYLKRSEGDVPWQSMGAPYEEAVAYLGQ